MSRVPPIAPSDLDSEQKSIHDEMSKVAETSFGDQCDPAICLINNDHGSNQPRFIYKRSDGAFVGPFAPLLHSHGGAKAFFNVMIELAKIPGLPASARETAILATGSHWQAPYEIYAHERVAAASTSLSQAQIDFIKRGEKPDGLDEKCGAAFDVAIELVRIPGPLRRDAWERAERSLGKDGTLALVHYVGYYSYTCLLLNACDVPLPDGERIK